MVLGETSFRLWDTRMDKLFIELLRVNGRQALSVRKGEFYD